MTRHIYYKSESLKTKNTKITSMAFTYAFLMSIMPVLFLAGCGGSGTPINQPDDASLNIGSSAFAVGIASDDASTSVSISNTAQGPLAPPRVFQRTYDFDTTGTPSTRAAANQNLQNVLRRAAAQAEGVGRISGGGNLFSGFTATPIASTESGATQAWDLGWTGKGVKAAVFDRSDLLHGAVTPFVVGAIAPEADIKLWDLATVRIARLGFSLIEAGTIAAVGQGYNIINMQHVSGRLDQFSGAIHPSEQAHRAYVERFYLPFVRSYGLPSRITAPNGDLIQNPQALDADMLMVIPVGNDRPSCLRARSQDSTFSDNLIDCSDWGLMIALLRADHPKAGDRILFVGALSHDDNDPNTPDTIADYSNRPGEEFKHDFISTYANILVHGDQRGTSWSSPLVTGAAALIRHKFPNLDGAGLKQVLVQTADDLGATGPDPIYGMGKMNLINALSPKGKVTPR